MRAQVWVLCSWLESQSAEEAQAASISARSRNHTVCTAPLQSACTCSLPTLYAQAPKHTMRRLCSCSVVAFGGRPVKSRSDTAA